MHDLIEQAAVTGWFYEMAFAEAAQRRRLSRLIRPGFGHVYFRVLGRRSTQKRLHFAATAPRGDVVAFGGSAPGADAFRLFA